jgi:hypothetical protein
MKGAASFVLAVAVGLLVIAVAAPALTALADTLLPLVIVGAVAVAVLRLLFVHTRRW